MYTHTKTRTHIDTHTHTHTHTHTQTHTVLPQRHQGERRQTAGPQHAAPKPLSLPAADHEQCHVRGHHPAFALKPQENV
jgi:hypothetical protein